MISITRRFTFESAHAISEHEGKCRFVHGHSYTLEVCVTSSELNELGMVMDFKELKGIVTEIFVDPMDHALVLKRDRRSRFVPEGYDGKLFLMDHEPTAEHMLLIAKERIQSKLPEGIQLLRMKLFETANSFAEWSA